MMNALITTLIAVLTFSFTSTAQSNYEAKMKEALNLWQKGENKVASTSFKSIAQNHNENWLPLYYAALIEITDSFREQNSEQKEVLLNNAQEMLNKAEAISSTNAELIVLQAMLHTSRLVSNPEKYGMELSPVIDKIYSEAQKIAPENPRVVLSITEWNMGAAKYFGENPAQYCGDIQKSLDLFEKETVKTDFSPQWGKERATSLSAITCKN